MDVPRPAARPQARQPDSRHHDLAPPPQARRGGASTPTPGSPRSPSSSTRRGASCGEAREYYQYKRRCLYCDILRQEIAAEARIVRPTHASSCSCPTPRAGPLELWILPRQHACSYEDSLNLESATWQAADRDLRRAAAPSTIRGYELALHPAQPALPNPRRATGPRSATTTLAHRGHDPARSAQPPRRHLHQRKRPRNQRRRTPKIPILMGGPLSRHYRAAGRPSERARHVPGRPGAPRSRAAAVTLTVTPSACRDPGQAASSARLGGPGALPPLPL